MRPHAGHPTKWNMEMDMQGKNGRPSVLTLELAVKVVGEWGKMSAREAGMLAGVSADTVKKVRRGETEMGRKARVMLGMSAVQEGGMVWQGVESGGVAVETVPAVPDAIRRLLEVQGGGGEGEKVGGGVDYEKVAREVMSRGK